MDKVTNVLDRIGSNKLTPIGMKYCATRLHTLNEDLKWELGQIQIRIEANEVVLGALQT